MTENSAHYAYDIIGIHTKPKNLGLEELRECQCSALRNRRGWGWSKGWRRVPSGRTRPCPNKSSPCRPRPVISGGFRPGILRKAPEPLTRGWRRRAGRGNWSLHSGLIPRSIGLLVRRQCQQMDCGRRLLLVGPDVLGPWKEDNSGIRMWPRWLSDWPSKGSIQVAESCLDMWTLVRSSSNEVGRNWRGGGLWWPSRGERRIRPVQLGSSSSSRRSACTNWHIWRKGVAPAKRRSSWGRGTNKGVQWNRRKVGELLGRANRRRILPPSDTAR